MIRDELLNGESLWSTLKNKWPERPMTMLNKLKKRYDCHRSKVVTRGILKDPNLA